MQVPRKRRWGTLAAGALFVAAGLLLGQLNHQRTATDSHAALAAVRKLATVRTSPLLRTARETVDRFDDNHDLVLVSSHGRLLAQALVDRAGRVTAWQQSNLKGPAYGSSLIFAPEVLVGLAVAYLLALAVRPLTAVRNLDLLAILLLLVPTYLLERWYVSAAVWSALPSLVYLMVRCVAAALNSSPGSQCASEPLLAMLRRRLPADARRRLGALAVALLAIVYLCAVYGTTTPIDVAYAVMGGATQIVHGVLPYGHSPGQIIHGDTYPILSYVAYIPLALLEPVRSDFDSIQLELLATAFAAIACGGFLWRLAGWAPALVWLGLPVTLLTASSGTSDVVLSLILVLTVVAGRVPLLAVTLASAGVWFKLTPVVLLPILLAGVEGRRGIGLAIVVAVSASCIGLVLALGGAHGPAAMLSGLRYQLNRSPWQSIWSSPTLQDIRPWAEAAALTLICWLTAASFWNRAIVREPARLAAGAAAALIAVELVAPYWTFLYLCWVLPLLGLALFSGTGTGNPERNRWPAWARG